ncbi:MAG TPA: membrane protein insertion efficiency factor YidD [Flavobacteriales bacterium]|nr:membrane protein insertion efficiency factor YidD [Flavobacteriales bacterium]HIA12613.1 membrane protein insertion efficiency factor YidD [Flavobacteriales bacterium]HIB43598.1 membrane protein insertion efficiency factor YidD [Nitrospina sp.]HIO72722.1 membrane protein insertion efficiency factor YidD [Flavobacteriales bacterium]
MKKVLSSAVILLIKVYQKILSPMFVSVCRYTPTCSQYGIEAIRKHGPFKGVYLLVKRIVSCHPWGKHGYDPVP